MSARSWAILVAAAAVVPTAVVTAALTIQDRRSGWRCDPWPRPRRSRR